MTKQSTKYESNPFFIVLNGLNNFFKKAQSVAIAAAVISVIGVLGQAIEDTTRFISSMNGAPDTKEYDELFAGFGNSTSDIVVLAVLIASFLFIAILISVFIRGVADYTSAQLSVGNNVRLPEVLRVVIEHFGSYLWLQIQVFVRVLLWSLLLILPGIYKSIRYSLAGTVFFAEKLHGKKAIARSEELVDGAWMTTFAAHALWNVITLGVIELVLAPGTNAELYRQYREVELEKAKKPAVHWLSLVTFWLAAALIIFLVTLMIVGLVTLAIISQSWN